MLQLQIDGLGFVMPVLTATKALRVREVIMSRAPHDAIAGGPEALASAMDALLNGWIETAEKQTKTGGNLAYGRSTHALLHEPLDPALRNLEPEHQAFKAGWSMRDVEATVPLDIRQPNGAALSLPQGRR